jgi:hypothetical protein
MDFFLRKQYFGHNNSSNSSASKNDGFFIIPPPFHGKNRCSILMNPAQFIGFSVLFLFMLLLLVIIMGFVFSHSNGDTQQTPLFSGIEISLLYDQFETPPPSDN